MKIFVQILIVSLVLIEDIWCECDECQSSNFVACHEENVFSLCINGSATKDFITCPKNYVCSSDLYVCSPRHETKPSCERKINLCGVCNEKKVYACTNETTIAFCYGADKPVEGAEVSYCLGNTICDIHRKKGFCTESSLVEPSCVTSDGKNPETTTNISTTTIKTSTLETTTPRLTTTAKTTASLPLTITAQPFTTTTTTRATTTAQQSTAASTSTTFETTSSTRTTTTEATVPTQELTYATSTTTITTTTTTASIPTDPEKFCKLQAASGSFSANDPTCTTFMICYMMGGSITGLKKKCPRNQYFSSVTGRCGSKKPDFCI